MKLIEPSYHVETSIEPEFIYPIIERAGRTCYKSEGKIQEGTADQFIHNIINRGHESVLEHASFTVRFICDRGVTHEIVRHRLCAFSQESTRYCNYGADKFDNQVTFIQPPFFLSNTYQLWAKAMQAAETAYLRLLENGATPQEARSVLPNSLKTEIVVTANVREWRHILKLRCSKAAHPQMRQLMIPLLRKLQDKLPVLFGDICHEA